MTCPDEGLLRAYLDRELPARRADELARHVGACDRCREQLGAIEKTAEFARSRFSRLGPAGADQPTEAAFAFADLRRRSEARPRLAERLAGFARLLSPARLGAAVVSVALVSALLFTPVGLQAQGLLGIFRANEVVAVQIDPTALLNLPEPEDLGTATLVSKPEIKVATLAEAGRQASLKPRTLASVPTGLTKDAIVFVSTPVEGSYTYDLRKIEAYYAKRGLKTKPPAELGGLTVTGSVQPVVLQVYADQESIDQIKAASKATPETAMKSASRARMLVFVQVNSPKLEVPGGVDVKALRQKLLDSGAFPPELALQLQAIENWQQTLPVPVLQGTSRDVTVDGVHGVLVSERESGGSWLIWLKDGVVYGLGGTVAEADLLTAAKSLSQ